MGPLADGFFKGAAWVGGVIASNLVVKLFKAGVNNVGSSAPEPEDPLAAERARSTKLLAASTVARVQIVYLCHEDEIKRNDNVRANLEAIKKSADEVAADAGQYIELSEGTANKFRSRLAVLRESLWETEAALQLLKNKGTERPAPKRKSSR